MYRLCVDNFANPQGYTQVGNLIFLTTNLIEREKLMPLITCNDCSNEISDKANACPKCGSPIEANQTHIQKAARGDKSRVTAAILALFLGGLGIHKFYLGQTGIGVVYLIFCWTFIPAILGLIEGIMYLCHTDERFQEAFVKT